MKKYVLLLLLIFLGTGLLPAKSDFGESADEICSYAYFLYTKKNYEEALLQINRAIKMENDNYQFYIVKGVILKRLRMYGEALRVYKKAIRIDKGSYHAYTNMGNVYYNMGNFTKALYYHKIAVEMEPLDKYVYNNRGNAHFQLGDYEAALADFTKAIDLDTNYLSPYLNRGKLFCFMGEFEKAINDYDTAISKYPGYTNPNIHRLFFAYLFSLDKYQSMLSSPIITESNREDERFIDTLSFFRDNMAVYEFEEKYGGTTDPEDLCDYYFILGFKYLTIGETAKAKEAFSSCIATSICYYVSHDLAQYALTHLL